MQIEYRNTLPDIIRFHLYHFPRALSFQLVFAFAIVMFGKEVIALEGDHSLKIISMIILVIGMYLFFAVTVSIIAVLNHLPKQNKGILTTHRVTLTDDGVEEETEVGQSRNSWSSIPKVVQNRSFILLYVQQNMAHVIPKRAFDNPEEARRFFEKAKAFHRTSKGAT